MFGGREPIVNWPAFGEMPGQFTKRPSARIRSEVVLRWRRRPQELHRIRCLAVPPGQKELQFVHGHKYLLHIEAAIAHVARCAGADSTVQQRVQSTCVSIPTLERTSSDPGIDQRLSASDQHGDFELSQRFVVGDHIDNHDLLACDRRPRSFTRLETGL
jgi:hypothetical protein